MMKISAVFGLVLLSCSFQAEARSSGAPNAACGNLVPRHASNQAGNDPLPYKVDLSTLMSGYNGGRNYEIQLKGTSRDTNFRGFLIQARAVGDDSPVGSFDSGTTHQQVCNSNTAATHVNNRQKTQVDLQWTAPPAGTGPVKFWFSFVDIHRRPRSRFWAREMSNVINEATCPGKGEIEQECIPDPSCARTCANRFFVGICPLLCVINGSFCGCPDGTFMDEDRNECVSANDCPEMSCPINGQIYTADCFGTNATCSNPNPPQICDAPQCVCPRGQVIDEATNACISGTECSQGCDIRRITGRVSYSRIRRRLTLRFSTNRQGQDASFQCRIDSQRFRSCTSRMVWRDLNLRLGTHSVTVRGSCMYNGGVASTRSRRISFRVRILS